MNKILKVLEENARYTNQEIAVMLGITEDEVAQEIHRLEEDGIIRGYKTIVDREKLSDEYVSAIIELRVTPKRDLGFDEIAEKLAEYPEVEDVYLMSGGYDLAVTVCGRTFRDVALFVAKRLSTLDAVTSTATHFVLRRYKDNGVMFPSGEKDMRGVQ